MQWTGTCDMNNKLCKQLGTPKGAFPTPWEIAGVHVDVLKAKCRLGCAADDCGGA